MIDGHNRLVDFSKAVVLYKNAFILVLCSFVI